MRPIPLGPFELLEPLGQGGMSQVWRGRHVEQDISVAIKVMTGERALEGEFRAAFRNEVRAVAALDHPGIVMVFEYGEIDDAAERLSGGALAADCPYLVMERATRSLTSEPMPWVRLRPLLVSLLDALAHAHARGVVHRDLKPSNVLLTQGPGTTRWKLSDFGVSHAMDRAARGTQEDVYGTPAYMAPEQFWGHWRDYGPWTDLYALGCMAWRLATGSLPFHGANLLDMARGHLHRLPPDFETRHPMPAGLEGWLRRNLQKRPARRFTCAADAAWGLVRLGDVDGGLGDDLGSGESDDLTSETTTLVLRRDDIDGLLPEPGEDPDTDAGQVLSPRLLPSMPRRWERRSVRRSMQLVGAGLGLYGLRTIPMVDREPERDAIWRDLRRVREDGDMRVVLLHGPAGCGKSAVAEWMCQRAQEVGAATVLKAVHGPMTGAAEGLPRLVARSLGCVGLERGEVLERVTRLLKEAGVEDDYEHHALTELVLPATEVAGERVVRFTSPEERHVLVRRLLERVVRASGEARPVILWLEDVQWGADALSFVEYLYQAERFDILPLLVLMTARDEALADRPLESQLLDEVMRWPRTRQTAVGALDRVHRSALVRELLGLQGDLAVLVEERTAGNPLFAVELVGDWVQRGVLVATPTGFALAPGEDVVLPDGLHSVWRGRLVRLLAPGASPGAVPGAEVAGLEALELASALGQGVDREEWEAVCRVAGVDIPASLVDRLLGAHLVHDIEGGFAFTHNMLRESLTRSARDAGRWEDHNRAAAEVLRQRGHLRDAARLGRHLLAAGELEAALEPLVEGARHLRRACEFRQLFGVLTERDTAMRSLDLDEADPRWAEAEVLRSEAWRETGDMDRAAAASKRAEEHSWRHGNDKLLGAALVARAHVCSTTGDLAYATQLFEGAQRVFEALGDALGATRARAGLAEVARSSGEMDRCEELFQEVVSSFEALDEPLDLADALTSLGMAQRQRGELEAAEASYHRALPVYRTIGQQRGVAQCLRGVGNLAEMRGQWDEAVQLLDRALDISRGIGSPSGTAACLNGLAEVARRTGDLERAERLYRESLRIYEGAGNALSFIVACNLGLVLVAQYRFAEARAVFGEALREVEAQGRQGWAGAVHAMMLVTTVGDSAAWTEHHQRATALLGETGLTDPDIIWALRRAGQVARLARRPEQARQALELALEQCRLQGEGSAEAEVLAELESLD